MSLESLVTSYEGGASIRELAEAFPDILLPDIHATIAYYLKHRDEIDEYMASRKRAAEGVERRLREEFPEAYRRVTPGEERAT